MGGSSKASAGAAMLAELKEFAGFSKATQRFIRRSLDIGLERRDPIRRWARSPAETASIRRQAAAYRRLEGIRSSLGLVDSSEDSDVIMGPLVAMGGFDLGENRLPGFGSYRFLYERLLGAAVRPWLPAAFCASAALPHIHPDRRRELLRSISEAVATAPGWSLREPAFVPDWVEKVELEAAEDGAS